MPGTGFDEVDTQKVNLPKQIASADGAINIKNGVVVITKGSAAALTLANPVAGADDLKELLIFAVTAFAHTISNAGGAGFNGGGAASDVATFTAAKGNTLRLRAYQGVWYVVNSTNATLA